MTDTTKPKKRGAPIKAIKADKRLDLRVTSNFANDLNEACQKLGKSKRQLLEEAFYFHQLYGFSMTKEQAHQPPQI
jgi:hypothetical protein